MWEFGALLLLLAILGAFLAPRFLRAGPGGGAQEGTVLVTGGGSGMGLAMATAFAQGGAKVAVIQDGTMQYMKMPGQ